MVTRSDPRLWKNLPPAKLAPDLEQIRMFVHAVFQRCRTPAWVSLRAFANSSAGGRPTEITPVHVPAGLWDAVSKAAWLEARKAANHPDGRVFAPPVATFTTGAHAREADLLQCPVLVWDLDTRPACGLARLREVLGEPTIIVASGGAWEGEPKAHVYYRLTEPAAGDAAALVKNVRKGMSRILGSDSSADSTVHPMRWPGSWHTKREPVHCRIVGGDHRREIDLHDAARTVLALLPQPIARTRKALIRMRGGHNVVGREEGLIRTVLRAPVGQHNTTLHWALKRVADMRGGKEINDAEVTSLADAVCRAALSIGHPPNRVASTRRSALGAR